MYNSGNSSKNVTGASVVDGTLENADFPDNGLSGDKVDGGTISNFTSTGIDDNATSTKLTVADTGIDVTGSVTCDNDITVRAGNPIINITSDNTGQGKIKFGGTTDPDAGIVAYSDNDDSMRFTTDNTEKMRILASGGITFNGDTAAANALDDYEEGEFTPDIQPTSGSITWSTSADTLSYIKIGSVVHIFGRLIVSSVSSPSGITRGSLPFTKKTLGDEAERATGTCLISGTTLNANDFGLYPGAGLAYLEPVRINTNVISRDAGSYLGAGDYLDITFTYYAA